MIVEEIQSYIRSFHGATPIENLSQPEDCALFLPILVRFVNYLHENMKKV